MRGSSGAVAFCGVFRDVHASSCAVGCTVSCGALPREAGSAPSLGVPEARQNGVWAAWAAGGLRGL